LLAAALMKQANSQLTDAVDKARKNEQEANDRQQEAVAATKTALNREYEAYLAQLRAGRYSGRPGQRFEGLRTVRKALRPELFAGRPPLDLRNEAIACLCLADVDVAQE